MVQLLFTLSSHMLFIYVSFYLLKNLVRWEKVLKVTAENTGKVRLLVALFSIVMGYIMSSFFISLYQLWQERLEDYYKIKSKGSKYGKNCGSRWR